MLFLESNPCAVSLGPFRSVFVVAARFFLAPEGIFVPLALYVTPPSPLSILSNTFRLFLNESGVVFLLFSRILCIYSYRGSALKALPENVFRGLWRSLHKICLTDYDFLGVYLGVWGSCQKITTSGRAADAVCNCIPTYNCIMGSFKKLYAQGAPLSLFLQSISCISEVRADREKLITRLVVCAKSSISINFNQINKIQGVT